MIVRDEADIIGECMEHLLSWCDALHVYDTGSTDGTWDLVNDAARRDRRVNPLASEPVVPEGDTRGYLFSRVRHTFRAGDWVARVDADEFYHVSPREWLPAHVRPHESRVFAQMYEFVLTHAELASHERGEYVRAIDRALPVPERLNRCVIEPVVEPRFFRFRRNMHWAPTHGNPWNPGLPAVQRIPVRHYRWRSFEQMRSRCELRRAMAAISYHGVHWHKGWREWLWDDRDPRLLTWRPGDQLPRRNHTNHLSTGMRKVAQQLLYRSGLPHVLDVVRRPWPDGVKPRPLPQGTVVPRSGACVTA